jgi:hypothetical protein
MPKRIKFLFVSLFTMLVFIITACSVAPFNTEADLEYAETGMAYQVELGGELRIPVENENGVEAKAKEVKIDVYQSGSKLGSTITITKSTDKGTILSGTIDGNSSGEVVVLLEGLDLIAGQEIKIVEIKFEDLNENDIKLGNIVKAIEVTSSTDTGGGSTTDSLTAVSGLTATVNGTTITLKWAEHANALVGYRVYKMESENGIYDSSLEQEIVVENGVTTSQTEYQDKNLTDGYTYFYKVTAYSGTKETPKQSIPVNVTVEEEIIVVTIPAPQNVQGESDIDQATITWDEVEISAAEIIGYNIYVVEKAGTGSEKLYRLDEFPGREDLTEEEKQSTPNILKATTITLLKGAKYGEDKEIVTGKDYYIKVAAVRGDNLLEGQKSEASKIYLYNGNAPVVIAYSDFQITPKGTVNEAAGDSLSTVGAKLSWSDKDGVIEYIIERAENAAGPYDILTTITEGESAPNFNTDETTNWFIDGSFLEVPGRELFYRIRCVTAEGIGKNSAAISLKDVLGLAIPIVSVKTSNLLVIDFDAGRFKPEFVLWNEEEGEPATVTTEEDHAGYKVYICDTYNGDYKLMADIPDLWYFEVDLTQDIYGEATGYNVPGEYYIRVKSTDWFGNESEFSKYRSFDVN